MNRLSPTFTTEAHVMMEPHLRIHPTLSVILLVTVMGCSQELATPGTPGEDRTMQVGTGGLAGAAAFEVMAAVQGRNTRGFEDELLRLESRAPGLGGVFLDEQGAVSAWVTSSGSELSVVRELRAAGMGAAYAGPLSERLRSGNIRVMRGEFAFSELVAAKRLIAQALRLPGIVSMDADESKNRVRVAVSAALSTKAVSDALDPLGLPDGIVQIEVVDLVYPLATLRGRFRPTSGGIQLRNSSESKCSIGYNVSLYAYADTGFITASHCDAGGLGSGSTGGLQYQNSVTPGDTVGRVLLNPAWTQTMPECMGYLLCTLADVMLVKSAPMSSWNKRVARTAWVGTNNTLGSIDIVAYYSGITVAPYAVVGQDVYKVGRTTGFTRGTLAGTCEDVVVGSSYVVLCANRVVNSAIGQGDSGAPVFYPPVAPYPFYAMGTLFAGGPFNDYNNDDGTFRCRSACTYYYNDWTSVGYHLNRYLIP